MLFLRKFMNSKIKYFNKVYYEFVLISEQINNQRKRIFVNI